MGDKDNPAALAKCLHKKEEGSTTSNRTKHLKTKHKEELAKIEEEQNGKVRVT